MPTTPKTPRQLQEDKARIDKLSERAASFHGRNPPTQATLRRPKTDPDLLAGRKLTGLSPPEATTPKLTKLLLNVTIERSLGAVHVVISPESTVGDLVTAAVRQYVKEGRRPYLQSTDPLRFDLHYSQFSLESLDREERLINLGSRNFFMCHSKKDAAGVGCVTKSKSSSSSPSSSSCSNQAEKASNIAFPWLRIKEFFI